MPQGAEVNCERPCSRPPIAPRSDTLTAHVLCLHLVGRCCALHCSGMCVVDAPCSKQRRGVHQTKLRVRSSAGPGTLFAVLFQSNHHIAWHSDGKTNQSDVRCSQWDDCKSDCKSDRDYDHELTVRAALHARVDAVERRSAHAISPFSVGPRYIFVQVTLDYNRGVVLLSVDGAAPTRIPIPAES